MNYLIATILALILTAICVVIHYEVLRLLTKVTANSLNHRAGLLIVIFGLLLAHMAEIWIYGFGYFTAQYVFGIGTLEPQGLSLFDLVYYSAMVYTTVGFGDILPREEIRMLTSNEALTGLALITWSASYTFLHMRKLWGT